MLFFCAENLLHKAIDEHRNIWNKTVSKHRLTVELFDWVERISSWKEILRDTQHRVDLWRLLAAILKCFFFFLIKSYVYWECNDNDTTNGGKHEIESMTLVESKKKTKFVVSAAAVTTFRHSHRHAFVPIWSKKYMKC